MLASSHNSVTHTRISQYPISEARSLNGLSVTCVNIKQVLLGKKKYDRASPPSALSRSEKWQRLEGVRPESIPKRIPLVDRYLGIDAGRQYVRR